MTKRHPLRGEHLRQRLWSGIPGHLAARHGGGRDQPLARLERLTAPISLVDAPQSLKLPAHIRLEPKDQPILLAAIHGKADYLLTGDARQFEHLYGKRIKGVLAMRPAQYFERHRRA